VYYLDWSQGESYNWKSFDYPTNPKNSVRFKISSIAVNFDGSQVWCSGHEGNRQNTYFRTGTYGRWGQATVQHPKGRGAQYKVDASSDGETVMYRTDDVLAHMRFEMTVEEYKKW
jgi:hypothetical protein